MRAVSTALALTVGLAGCSSGVMRDPFNPNFLSGDDAAKRVDIDFGGMVAASHPSVTVGRARCPFLIDLSGGHTGRCSLPVTGGEMRVDVSASRAPTGVRSPDTLIVRSEAEPRIAAELAGSGVRVAVRCPGPAVRVAPNDTTIHCALTGARVSHGSVRVEFAGYDDLFVFGSKNSGTRLDTLLDRAVTSRTDARIVLDGSKLGPYLRAVAGGAAHDELERRRLIGVAHCPSRITLTWRAHAACTVRVGSATLPYDLRFDQGRGLVVEADPTVEILAVLRERAERFFIHVIPIIDPSLPAGSRIRVDCGGGTVALLTPGEGLPCTAYAAKQAFPFAAQLLSSGGNVTFVGRHPEN